MIQIENSEYLKVLSRVNKIIEEKTSKIIEKEQMKDQVKDLRVKIDGIAQLCSVTKPDSPGSEYGNLTPRGSKQVEKATDNLYFAKAWLGKILGGLGQDNPYKSGYKTKEDIEPTADVSQEVPFGDKVDEIPFRDKNYIEKIDYLRQEIKSVIQEAKELRVLDYSIELRYLDNCLTQLETARFELGFELQRIKEDGE